MCVGTFVASRQSNVDVSRSKIVPMPPTTVQQAPQTKPSPPAQTNAAIATPLQHAPQNAPSSRAQTKTVIGTPSNPEWIAIWKDTADALQSSVTFLAVLAGAVWFLRRRQRFPRANVSHQVVHWKIENKVILHTVVRVQNVGEVVLHLTSVSIRAQQLAPTPEGPLSAIRSGADPVKAAETEILWPSISERKCDWSKAPHEVEPGETEEIHFDLLMPEHIQAVEVYTYIKNHVKRRRDIGWGTNTLCKINEVEAFVVQPKPADVEDRELRPEERIPIMATNRDQGLQDTQKQQGQKAPTSVPSERRQGPEKTSTSSSSGSSTPPDKK